MRTATWDLQFLDVITISEPSVANGSKDNSEPPGRRLKVLVGYEEPETGASARNDETRVNAKFVVLQVNEAGNRYGGPDCSWTEVLARRLNEDGTYDAKGELIVFKSAKYPSIRYVDKVAEMRLVP